MFSFWIRVTCSFLTDESLTRYHLPSPFRCSGSPPLRWHLGTEATFDFLPTLAPHIRGTISENGTFTDAQAKTPGGAWFLLFPNQQSSHTHTESITGSAISTPTQWKVEALFLLFGKILCPANIIPCLNLCKNSQLYLCVFTLLPYNPFSTELLERRFQRENPIMKQAMAISA